MIYIANKKGNKFIFKDDYVIMLIKKRNGEEFEILLSYDNYEKARDFNYTWGISWYEKPKCYYVRATVHLGMIDGKQKNTSKKLHHYLMDAKPDEVVDHINHNTLDNRSENLRVTKTLYNTKHRETRNSNNVTGYRNVAYIKGCKGLPYWVQIMVNGKNTVMGKFNNPEDAGEYAEKMRLKYYKDFAGQN